MRELSLREGDIVKIYSKIGGDQGWWKGEANGRVIKQANDLKLSFKYYNISNINCHYFPVFHSDWMVPLYVRRWGGGAVKLWGQRSSNKIHSPGRGLFDFHGNISWKSFSLETHFTMNICTFVSFHHVRICFFFSFLGISVWFLWRKLLRVCSFSAVGGGNWTEQNLPWSGQRTSMALSLYRNTCKVRWGIMGGGDV